MTRLYSNLKILRYADRIEALREGRIAAPVHVRIKPINHCNHDCWYCAYRVGNLQLGEEMDERDRIPDAKLMEIAGDLVEMGVQAVTFSGGGEPLLYRSLPEVIERLAAGGVRVAALTNGANLKGRMADAFARHATWVRVSLDGYDDESYARARGIEHGQFTRLLHNMAEFAARGSRCVLGASFIIGAGNAGHIADVCRQLKAIGVNHVKLAGAVVGNGAAENNAYHRAIADRAGPQIALAKTLADERFAVLDHYHELEERFDKDYRSCPFARFLTVIGADCQVYACQDKAYTAGGRLGSIRERSFQEFWFSPETAARLREIDPSVSCRHHCVAHQKNLALHEMLSLDTEHARFV